MANKHNPRVLFISYEFNNHVNGGIGRVINGLYPELSKIAFCGVLLLRLNYLKTKLIGQAFKFSSNNKPKAIAKGNYLKVLQEIILSEQYNIVHILHNGLHMDECLRYLKKHHPSIRTIYSCHSLCRYEYNIRKPKEEDLRHEEFILNQVDEIHLLNASSLKFLQKSYPNIHQTKSFSVIPNGISEKEYRKISSRLNFRLNNKSSFTIACISRWSHGKGIETLIDAFSLLIDQKVPARLLIAGRKKRSWEHNVGEYVAMIDKKINALNGHAKALGWLNDKERNTLLQTTDILVMPSEIEYFPYSILEPMACKTPIISSNIECANELSGKKKLMLFFKKGDPKDLAEKIKTLMFDQELQKNLSQEAFMEISNRYQWKPISNNYLEMFKKVLSN